MEKLYAMTILLNIATCKLSNVDLLILLYACLFAWNNYLLQISYICKFQVYFTED